MHRGCIGLKLTVHGGIASEVTGEDFNYFASVFLGCLTRKPLNELQGILQGDHRLYPFTLAAKLELAAKCVNLIFLILIKSVPHLTCTCFGLFTDQHDDVADGREGLPIDDSEPHCFSATSEFREGDELCHVIFWIWNCLGVAPISNSVTPLRTKLDPCFDHIFALGCTRGAGGVLSAFCYQHQIRQIPQVQGASAPLLNDFGPSQ